MVKEFIEGKWYKLTPDLILKKVDKTRWQVKGKNDRTSRWNERMIKSWNDHPIQQALKVETIKFNTYDTDYDQELTNEMVAPPKSVWVKFSHELGRYNPNETYSQMWAYYAEDFVLVSDEEAKESLMISEL